MNDAVAPVSMIIFAGFWSIRKSAIRRLDVAPRQAIRRLGSSLPPDWEAPISLNLGMGSAY